MTTITFHSDNTSRQRREAMMFGLLRVAAGINILALVGVCVFLLWNGSPAISWEFLTEPPRRMMTAGGVWPCIVGTFLLAFGAMLIAFPLGVASAVYLHEYGGKGRYTRYLRLGISNLAGVPSVVFGLFGLAFFVTFLGMGVSLLAGVLTLAVLTLPVIINTTEEALRQVPDAWREASLALGATRSQTIARVVLPAAVPGMLTGAILGLARAAGETAAIMFTAAVFYTPKMPDSVFSAVMSLPYHMYVLATAGTEIEKTRPLQYGTALILLVLVLGMNLIAIIIRDRMQRKRPRCRVGIVLTDVELQPDPLYNGPQLCNRCMACVKACPGGCFPTDRTVKTTLAGREVEWSDLDMARCDMTFRGAAPAETEQKPPYMEWGAPTKPGSWSPFYRKPRNLYNTGQAVCGSRGCTRACMISLETRGVLQNSFRQKFRRRPQWSVDWSTPPEYAAGTVFRPDRTGSSDVD